MSCYNLINRKILLLKFFFLINLFFINQNILSIFEENIWHNRNLNIDSFEQIEPEYNKIWLKIDLMQAINIDKSQKINFCDFIFDELIYLYAITCKYFNQNQNNINNQDKLKYTISLLREIKESISEVFKDINNNNNKDLVFALINKFENSLDRINSQTIA